MDLQSDVVQPLLWQCVKPFWPQNNLNLDIEEQDFKIQLNELPQVEQV